MPDSLFPSSGVTDKFTPAIKKIRQEQPNMAQIPIEPAGFLGRMLGGSNEAVTNPFTGSVSYNPQNMQGYSPEQIENIFTHELTHSRQVQDTPYWNRLTNILGSMFRDDPYYERPREMAAFQSERDRNLKLGLNQPDPVTQRRDIQLPSPRRKKLIYPLIFLLLLPRLAQAENGKKAADIISYGTVATQIVLNTVYNWKEPDRKKALIMEGVKTFFIIAASETVKHNVKEARPDKSDSLSFWSEHSALASANMGYNYYVGVSLTLATMGGRVIAKKHHIWDTLAGAGIGMLVDQFIK